MDHEEIVWRVALVNDGCFRAFAVDPNATGTHEQCAQWIANHIPPYGGTMAQLELDIYPAKGNHRLLSYLVPRPTVMRRKRLWLADFEPPCGVFS